MNDTNPATSADRTTNQPTAEPTRPPRRRRRWLRWVLGIAIVLIVLIGVAPYLVSTDAGTRWLVGQVNNGIKGRVEVGDLSLSWLGPCRLREVKTFDLDGREVLAVPAVTYAPGLFAAILSPTRFERVAIDRPTAVLHVAADGSVSLVEALSPRTPKPPEPEPGELPELHGQLVVTDAAIRAVRYDGMEYEVNQINLDTRLNTLNDLAVSLDCVLGREEKLSATLSVRDLFRAGTVDLRAANAEVHAATDTPIDLHPIAQLAGRDDVQGHLSLNADVTMADGKTAGTFDLSVAKLAAGTPAGGPARPIDVKLAGTVSGSAEQITANVALDGDAGKTILKATYTPSDRPVAEGLSAADLLAVVAEGRPIRVPDFEATADGTLDVPRLAEAIPALMHLRRDVRVTRGTLALKKLTFRGGNSPHSSGQLVVQDFTAQRDGQTIQWPAMTLTVLLQTDPQGRLQKAQLVADADFAHADASAVPGRASLDADVALDRMHQRLSEVFDLGGTTMAGKAELHAGVDLQDTDVADLPATLTVTATDVRIAGAEAPDAASVINGTLDWRGRVKRPAAAGKQPRQLRLDGRLLAKSLALTRGKHSFKQDQLAVDHNVLIDPASRNVGIDRFDLTSSPDLLSVSLTGRVRDWDSRQALELTGQYQGVWQQINALLAQMSPKAAEMVQLAGRTGGAFRVSGPLSDPQVSPVYRQLDAAVPVGWKSGNLFGLGIGEAALRPRFADGKFTLPQAEIPASGGTVRLGGEVDLGGPQPVLTLPGRLAVLERVPITKEFGRQVLSRINPIFAQVASIEGAVSLDVDGVRLPLGDALKTAGQGRGHLDLSSVRMQPAGILGKLLETGGVAKGESVLVKVNGVDFLIRDGGVEYDNFIFVFADTFDLKFFGRVGFDDTVDMSVSVPVRAGLLGQLGVTGPVLQYARALEGMRFDIPVIGTRLKPRLDFSKVDPKPLIQKAIKGLVDVPLKNLLDPDKPDRKPTETTKPERRKPGVSELIKRLEELRKQRETERQDRDRRRR